MVTSVNGTHLSGKTDDDVKYFHSNGKKTNFFPRQLGNFFKNLNKTFISHTDIKSLTKDDLQFLGGDLKTFAIYYTLIEWLEADVFEYTPNLETIYLHSNKIKYVERGTFDQLKQLSNVVFNNNPCIDVYAGDRSAVLKLIPQIEEKCTEIAESFPTTHRAEVNALKDEGMKVKAELEKCEQEVKKCQYQDGIGDLRRELAQCKEDAGKTINELEQNFKKLNGQLVEKDAKINKLQSDFDAEKAKSSKLQQELDAERAKNIIQPCTEVNIGFQDLIKKFNKMEAKFDAKNDELDTESIKSKLDSITLKLDSNKGFLLERFTSINATCTGLDYKLDLLTIRKP